MPLILNYISIGKELMTSVGKSLNNLRPPYKTQFSVPLIQFTKILLQSCFVRCNISIPCCFTDKKLFYEFIYIRYVVLYLLVNRK